MREEYYSDYYKKNKLPRKAKELKVVPKKYIHDIVRDRRVKAILNFIFGETQ